MVQASPFCGKPNEEANAHLQNFLELCDTVVIQGVATDVVKLRLFPFSLLGKAKQWFYKENDIDTWAKCSKAFLAKNFPLGKTNAFSRENFKFPADRDGIHPRSLREAAGIHPGMSSSRHGRVAHPAKLLQRAHNEISSQY